MENVPPDREAGVIDTRGEPERAWWGLCLFWFRFVFRTGFWCWG